MCERNGTANTYNKYFLMLTYFFLFSTSINEHYNAHKRYIFFNLPSLLLKKTDFEFVTILKNRESNYCSNSKFFLSQYIDMYTRKYSKF